MSTRSQNPVACVLPLSGRCAVPAVIALASACLYGSPCRSPPYLGSAILGAAFVLSRAAELIQMDVSHGLALTLLARIAVLPEYALDGVLPSRLAAIAS